jgi:uncharacterized membrane protein
MLIIRLLHILAAFWFIGGLLGRWAAFAWAGRAEDIRSASALLRLSEQFESRMVIPGSQVVLVLGLLTAWLQGRPILGALQGGGENWLLASLLLSLATIPLVAFLLAPRRKLRRAALDHAVTQEAITPELRVALADRVVLVSRAAELAIVGAILLLMLLKPF